jgi:hypothetical protein
MKTLLKFLIFCVLLFSVAYYIIFAKSRQNRVPLTEAPFQATDASYGLEIYDLTTFLNYVQNNPYTCDGTVNDEYKRRFYSVMDLVMDNTPLQGIPKIFEDEVDCSYFITDNQLFTTPVKVHFNESENKIYLSSDNTYLVADGWGMLRTPDGDYIVRGMVGSDTCFIIFSRYGFFLYFNDRLFEFITKGSIFEAKSYYGFKAS